jgi:aspartate kinase
LFTSAIREDGSFDLSFSAPKEDSSLVEKSLEELGLKASQIDKSLTKVSLVGSGMQSHSGVAARVFKTLAKGSIPIVCTTTSEIKISCVVPQIHAEKALQSLHDEFCMPRN